MHEQNLCKTLTKLTAARDCALQTGAKGRIDGASRDGKDPTETTSSQRVHGDPGEFENVIGMSMMLLSLKMETGPRLKVCILLHMSLFC